MIDFVGSIKRGFCYSYSRNSRYQSHLENDDFVWQARSKSRSKRSWQEASLGRVFTRTSIARRDFPYVLLSVSLVIDTFVA